MFICYGALNIDYVYSVPHFVRPGETLSADKMEVFCGGKGLNQSIALARVDSSVYHAGKLGNDGNELMNELLKNNVNVEYLTIDQNAKSGNAIIQVDSNGQNCIILSAGTNNNITIKEIESSLNKFGENDWLVLQNEINNIEKIIEIAHLKGIKIAFNPAPMNDKALNYPIHLVDLLIINEVEGSQFTGFNNDLEIINAISKKYPNLNILLTLGSSGVKLYADKKLYEHGAYDVIVKDTTAAGDTFIGYFLAMCEKHLKEKATIDYDEVLRISSIASAICVSRMGASNAIPYLEEVLKSDLKLIKKS